MRQEPRSHQRKPQDVSGFTATADDVMGWMLGTAHQPAPGTLAHDLYHDTVLWREYARILSHRTAQPQREPTLPI